MGIITSYNKNIFKKSDFLFSKVKRFLKSFDEANIIDEGEFPTYTKEVLKRLGLGVYKESQALVDIVDGYGELPYNFNTLYSAYKIEGLSTVKKIQQSSFKFVTDVTKEYILESSSCQIDCCEDSKKLVESINVKTYVEDDGSTYYNNFSSVTPLLLSPNVQSDFINSKQYTNPREIGIDYETNTLYTAFNEGVIYIKYYGFPIDDDGNIMIPDIEEVEKAIEWYIIYQILLSGWFNSTIPDIVNKFKEAEIKFERAFQEAKNYLKTPSFTSMLNYLYNQRSQNKLVFMTQQYSNTNFQRTR